jgi:hypothetical protein
MFIISLIKIKLLITKYQLKPENEIFKLFFIYIDKIFKYISLIIYLSFIKDNFYLIINII